MNILRGNFLVFGVANTRSICWPIAQTLVEQGGNVTLASMERFVPKLARVAEGNGIKAVLPCDVTDEASVEKIFGRFNELAGLVHGVAFSDTEELKGSILDTSLENFRTTMEVSCYSLLNLARHATPLMTGGGSIITLTYIGGKHPVPHYNVMGPAKAALEAMVRALAFELGGMNIRVNAISASPEDTLSARGIGDFRLIGEVSEALSPMGRRATLKEIANYAAFLLGPQSTACTGQTHYVDCGTSVPHMAHPRYATKMVGAYGAIADRVKAKGTAE